MMTPGFILACALGVSAVFAFGVAVGMLLMQAVMIQRSAEPFDYRE